jgi:uncharacterized Zn finger protein (UPF0148 family)
VGRMKDELLEDPDATCSECGAPLEDDGDGRLACTNSRPCLAQIEESERRAEEAMARRKL